MGRWAVCLIVFAGLSVVVGAQTESTTLSEPDSVQQHMLFRQNRDLFDTLIDSSVQVSATDDPIKRVESGRTVIDGLLLEIERAGRVGDDERVTELGQHLKAVLGDGILPNMRQARGRIPRGSQEEKALFEHRDSLDRSVRNAAESLRRARANSEIETDLVDEIEAVGERMRSSTR